MRWTWSRVAAVVLAVGVVSGSSGCAEGVAVMFSEKDAAGMTRGEVSRLSMEEQFDLLGERYARAQELMTAAQLQVSDGVWKWYTAGLGTLSGPVGWDPLPGVTLENAYYLDMGRYFSPPGAVGAREDAEPMYAYFASQGWEAELREVPDSRGQDSVRFQVNAFTEDRFFLTYELYPDGHYNLLVRSSMYWTAGDQSDLDAEVMYRIPEGGVFPPGDESVPGVYTPFPKWSDPKVWSPRGAGE